MAKKILVLNDVAFNSGSLFEVKEGKNLLEGVYTPMRSVAEKKVEEEGPKKRGRKPKNKMYFTPDTEDAIIEYSLEKNQVKKNIIYNDRIKFSFNKLAENIINTFSFSYIPEAYEDVKTEVVSHMLLNCDKYIKDKGKAFSYFSVMAKNYLIIKNTQYYSELKSNYSIQTSSKSTDFEFDILDESHAKNITNQETSEFIKILVKYWELNIPYVFKKKRDSDIAIALVELLKNVASLEFFNKKALYLLIREMTGHKTQYITRVINKMETHYKKIREMYYATGNLEEEEYFFRKK